MNIQERAIKMKARVQVESLGKKISFHITETEICGLWKNNYKRYQKN